MLPTSKLKSKTKSWIYGSFPKCSRTIYVWGNVIVYSLVTFVMIKQFFPEVIHPSGNKRKRTQLKLKIKWRFSWITFLYVIFLCESSPLLFHKLDQNHGRLKLTWMTPKNKRQRRIDNKVYSALWHGSWKISKDKGLGGNTTPVVAKISVIMEDGLAEW